MKNYIILVWLVFCLPIYAQDNAGSTSVDIPTRETLKSEVDSIVRAIRLRYADPMRGTSESQWDSVVNVINTSLDTGNRFKEDYLYALRNFGTVINDGHLWFPDGGFFNREGFFGYYDDIFPVWTKTSKDNRIFVEKDWSGKLPHNAEILTINGLPADSLSRRSLWLCYGEKEYARTIQNKENGDPRLWNTFANLLFMENIEAPYIIEYRKYHSSGITKDTLAPMLRGEIIECYKKSRTKPGKAIYYKHIKENIGLLRIRAFYGGNIWSVVQTVIFGQDMVYPRLMRESMRKIKRDSPDNLIIDIRGNNGGSMEYMLSTLSYFTQDTLSLPEYVYVPYAGKSSVKEMIRVRMEKSIKQETLDSLLSAFDLTAGGGSMIMQNISAKKKMEYTYSGNIWLLIDEGIFSASMVFADLFRKHEIGVIAGTKSGAYRQVSSGNKLNIPLPFTKWLPLEIPYGMFYKPEKHQKYDFLVPDIEIGVSTDSWLSGKDVMLDRLIEIISSNNR